MAPDHLIVLLATHNGARVLQRTLQAYEETSAHDRNWTLVVVDNASTDETSDILSAFEEGLPLVSLFENTPGKNAALNTGLDTVLADNKGDLIILTDDDSLPQAGFLDAWRESATRLPKTDLFGASIQPIFDRQPPNWFLEAKPRFDVLYAQTVGTQEGPIGPEWIFGPNMAVRRRVFESGLRFQSGVGPDHTSQTYSMGSESEFCTRTVDAGYKAAFVTGPLVHHIVREHQILPKFWWARAYRFGRGIAQRHWTSGEFTPSRSTILRRMARPVIRQVKQMHYRIQALLPGQPSQFYRLWDYHFFRGFQDEIERLRSLESPHTNEPQN